MKTNNCLNHTAAKRNASTALHEHLPHQEAFDPTIKADFNNGRTYEGPLSGLKAWAIENRVSYPKACYINGQRHGLYPCFSLHDVELRAAMSVLKGCNIPHGEGLLYTGREALRRDLEALRAGGLELKPELCDWAVTRDAFAPVASRELI